MLENVVNTRLKRIRAEEKNVSGRRIGVRLSKRVLILADDLDVGAHQHLETRAEAVPCLMLRRWRAIQEVHAGIHGIVVKRADQPGIDPANPPENLIAGAIAMVGGAPGVTT